MQKTCNKCEQSKELADFRFRPDRGKHVSTCKSCEKGRVRKVFANKSSSPVIADEVMQLVPVVESSRWDLPEPDQLPAPYAKRVYEMWKALTGEAAPTGIRIA